MRVYYWPKTDGTEVVKLSLPNESISQIKYIKNKN